MENYKKIVNSIRLKQKRNTEYEKKYKIDLEKGYVTKYKKNSNSILEKECVNYLCTYYTKLGLNFTCAYIDNCLITKSPFVEVVTNYTIKPKKTIANETLRLLNCFAKTHSFFKEILKDNCFIKVFCDSYHPKNFFKYKDKIYLLDLEGFYLCVYDEDNNSIGYMGIKENYHALIKPYYLPEDSYHAIKQNNMLIY